MKFPSDLQVEKDTEYVKITPCEYKGGQTRTTGDSIKLYMPSGLSFSNSQKWNSVDWTPLGKEIINSAQVGKLLKGDVMSFLRDQGGLQSAGEELGRFVGDPTRFGPYAVQFGAGIGAGALQTLGQAMGVQSAVSAQAITGTVNGQILNPQTELFYEAPQLRSWAVSYVFAPKSKKDEQEMQKIIQFLKVNSTPAKGSNPWLEIPKVFKVEFMKGGSVNKNVPLLKPAALNQIDTILNPGLDYWASFRSGGPVMIGVAMRFSEIEIVYSEDHKKGNLGY